MNHTDLLIKYKKSLLAFFSGLLALTIFVSGLGGYRSILFIAVYLIIDAVIKANFNDSGKYAKLFALGLLLSTYIDIESGPIFVQIIKINVFVILAIYFLLENIFIRQVKKIIESITNGRLFAMCPICGYESIELKEVCEMCKENYISADLQASNLEVVLRVSIGGFTGNSAHKNSIRMQISEIVFKNETVNFVRKSPLFRGWRSKEVIPYNRIKSVELFFIKKYGKELPAVRITTDSETFDISTLSYRTQLIKKMAALLNEKRLSGYKPE